jgi:hypothetical protein
LLDPRRDSVPGLLVLEEILILETADVEEVGRQVVEEGDAGDCDEVAKQRKTPS